MIRDKHVFQEIPNPEAVSKMSEPPMLMLIYKAIYMSLRVLLDIRNNTSNKNVEKKSKHKPAFQYHKKEGVILQNTVIKPTDNIEVKDEQK